MVLCCKFCISLFSYLVLQAYWSQNWFIFGFICKVKKQNWSDSLSRAIVILHNAILWQENIFGMFIYYLCVEQVQQITSHRTNHQNEDFCCSFFFFFYCHFSDFWILLRYQTWNGFAIINPSSNNSKIMHLTAEKVAMSLLTECLTPPGSFDNIGGFL